MSGKSAGGWAAVLVVAAAMLALASPDWRRPWQAVARAECEPKSDVDKAGPGDRKRAESDDEKHKPAVKDDDDDKHEAGAKSDKDEKKDEADKEHDEGPKRVSHDAEGRTVITLDAATMTRMGLQVAPVVAATRHPTLRAYGRLQEDPAGVFELRSPVAGFLLPDAASAWPVLGTIVADGAEVGQIAPRFTELERFDLRTRLMEARAEMESLTASLAASRASLESKKRLSAGEKVVSERTVEEAEAKVKGEEAHLAAAQKKVALLEAEVAGVSEREPLAVEPLVAPRGGQVTDVGARPGEAVESGQVLLRLSKFDRLIARVELPIGEAATGKIESATVSPTGRDEAMASATVVGLAPSVHPELGGQTWLLAVDGADGSLRPGLAVTAELTMPGPATAGALAPAEAVVRHSGATWVYVRIGEGRFCRRRLIDGRQMTGGLFVTEEVKPGDVVVTRGAATLLSEELKSLAEEEEE